MADARRCRPGDLAIVIAGYSQNIGLPVFVVRSEIASDTCDFDPERPGWLCRAGGRDIFGTYEDGTTGWEQEWAMADNRLRPIRPPSSQAITKREVARHV